MKTAAQSAIVAWIAMPFFLASAWGQPTQGPAAGAPAATPQSEPNRPTLWLVGDSTVKNGRDNGAGVPFIDLNEIIARRYEADGQPKVVAEYFTASDHTHTTWLGALVNADSVVQGLKGLKDCRLVPFLLDKPEPMPDPAHGGVSLDLEA